MDAQVSMFSTPSKSQRSERPKAPLLKARKKMCKKVGLQRCTAQLSRCGKSRRETKKTPTGHCLGKGWAYLDSNILREIFSRVPTGDLFINISSVCLSWELVCWDILFWSHDTLDFSGICAGFGIPAAEPRPFKLQFRWGESQQLKEESSLDPNQTPSLESLEEKYNPMAKTLLKKLESILEGVDIYGCSLLSWKMSIRAVILPSDLKFSDQFLLYIAERTPKVKKLVLMGASRLTAQGFGKAIQNWKLVKEMHVGDFNTDTFKRLIEAAGNSCPELKSFHIHQYGLPIDDKVALLISQNLPHLKKVELDSSYLFAGGITTLCVTCLQLEEIFLKECYLIVGRSIDLATIGEYFYSFYLKWRLHDNGFATWMVVPYSEEIDDENPNYEYIMRWGQVNFDEWIDKRGSAYIRHDIL